MSEFLQRLRASVTVKLLFIGFLVLLLLIPMGMIENVINERNDLYRSAKRDIMNAWGREQTVGGPVLTLPYRVITTDDKGVRRVRQALAHFLPERLSIRGQLDTQMRYRGIYEVPVYTADLKLSGRFAPPDIARLGIDPRDVDWEEAFLSVAIADARGIKEPMSLRSDVGDGIFEPGGVKVQGFDPQVIVPLPGLANAGQPSGFQFGFELKLSGIDGPGSGLRSECPQKPLACPDHAGAARRSLRLPVRDAARRAIRHAHRCGGAVHDPRRGHVCDATTGLVPGVAGLRCRLAGATGRIVPAGDTNGLAMHGEAARNTDHLSGDVLGVVAGQKRDDAGNILGPADAFHGNGALERLENFGAVLTAFQELRQKRRIRGPGANRVQTDAGARKLPGDALGECDDTALAGGVDGLHGGAHPAGVGCDVHHPSPTLLAHARQHHVVHVERAVQVDGDDRSPLLGRGIEKIRETVEAGVVDQHVDTALLGCNGRHRLGHRLVVADVDHADRCPPPQGPHFFRRGAGRVGIAIEERHVASLLGQSLTDSGTDAAAGTGHQRDFVD
jgi:Inner membrane protein CreD